MVSEQQYDFRKAKVMLQGDVKGVLARLACHIHRPGATYCFIRPPSHPEADTFWVNVQNGSWRHEGKDERGDIIGLIAYVRREKQFEALKWAYQYLGWEQGFAGSARPLSDAELLRLEAEARRKQEKIERQRKERGDGFAAHWIYKALPARRTIVETYLRKARKLRIDLLRYFPHSIKFEPKVEHIDPETGEVTEWPAMTTLLSRDGGGTGIHRTYLLPDGSGKAPVKPDKMMYGVKAGSALRLTRGDGHYRPAYAAQLGHSCPFILGEGIETVLAVAPFVPTARAWAAGDLGNMRSFGKHACMSDVILLKDNDLHPDAVKAFDKVEAHWREETEKHGGRLIVASSDQGSDFADELQG